MSRYNSLGCLIGRTPTVRLVEIERLYGLRARLYAKLEKYNPSGSAKDRAAFYMIRDAVNRGLVGRGGTVVEATSGNMGISLSMLAAIYKLRLMIVMPENMSEQRRAIIKAYGGEVILTDADEGMVGAQRRAEEILAQTPDAHSVRQFENPMNSYAHYLTTGREIYRDLDGKADVLVSGVGTGGTLCGAGRYLKEKNPRAVTVAVEPRESAVLSGNASGCHGIQGIGAGFVPRLFDGSIVDMIYAVSTDEAEEMREILAVRTGVFAGISSGAVLCCGVDLARRKENTGKNIVMIFSDGGERYL